MYDIHLSTNVYVVCVQEKEKGEDCSFFDNSSNEGVTRSNSEKQQLCIMCYYTTLTGFIL